MDPPPKTAGSKPPPKLLRWFFPDLAMIAAILYFSLLFGINGSQMLLRDGDAGWHIRTGESILRTGELPRTDPYSFSRPNHAWFAWEWGADVLMGAVHELDGLHGVVLLYALAIAASTWLWIRLHWATGGNLVIAFAMVGPLFLATSLHWLARPHVLSWLFLLWIVLYFERASGEFRTRDAAILLAGVALWTNIHASFFFAPVIAGIYSVGYFARPLIWNLDPKPEFRKGWWFLYATLAASLASFLNPNGWDLHLHLYRYLTDNELLSNVAEFHGFDFHGPGAWPILAILGFAVLGGAAALAQKKLGHFLLSGMVVLVALRSARGIPLAALLVLPLANGAITEILRNYSDFRPSLRGLIDRFLAYCDELRLLDSHLSGVALAPAVALLGFVWVHTPAVAARTGFPAWQFPVAASAAVAELPEDARVLAPDMYGGYLIYRFRGRRKVYFDGRSDFYGSDFVKRYLAMVAMKPGWQRELQSMRFTHALLPNNYPLIDGLEDLGWKRVYGDNVATLLKKP